MYFFQYGHLQEVSAEAVLPFSIISMRKKLSIQPRQNEVMGTGLK